jgi:hypothetical protein
MTHTSTTLVTGGNAAQREAAIAALIDTQNNIDGSTNSSTNTSISTAVILEGMTPGVSHLAEPAENLHIVRIAPGCMCCVGNLTLRVTLNRILRKPPARLFISLAATSHLAQIQAFLSQAPYDTFLNLTSTVDCNIDPIDPIDMV